MANKTKYVNTFGVKKGGIKYTIPEGKKDAGETRVLLTPEGKRAKYKHELETGQRFTNDGKLKLDEKHNNAPIRLSDLARAHRQGYLAAQNEQRAIYARNHAQKK